MSAPTVSSLFQPVIEAAIDLLWHQWSAVGGLARSTGTAHGAIIDPEALVLASHALSPQAPRLKEELALWLREHAELLSMQRLTNLAAQAEAFPHDLSAIAAMASRGSQGHRWKRLAGTGAPPDRPPRDRALPPLTLQAPTTLMLRLRLGMGVGAKADVLSFLLGSATWCSAQEVRRATGYTIAAVRRTLEELTAARFILAEDPPAWQSQRARHYRAESAPWRAVLGTAQPLPSWGFCHERFAFVVQISQWMHPGNAAERWNAVQMGHWGMQWMEQHPLAFRFGSEDRAAFRGALTDWGSHFRESLTVLTNWFRPGAQTSAP